MSTAAIPFFKPSIGQEEIDEVADTLRSGWITTGHKAEAFERRFASYIGADAALALSSGTAALHVALAALGVGPGDVVATTPMTFCSTLHVIEHVGARPLLVDVAPDTLNLDPCRLDAAVQQASSAVRAILPVHLYGHPCEMDVVAQIAQAQGAVIVDDAAHALPARFNGELIGSYAMRDSTGVRTLTCFSFYATKNLTTGEGGMLVGARDEIDEASLWSLHGLNRDAWRRYSGENPWRYEVVRAGFKYNMSDIQAAIGLHQLAKLDAFHERRRNIAARYDAGLSELEAIETPTARGGAEHAWHLYVIRLRLEMLAIDRSRFIDELRQRNIGTSVHFIPVHLHPYYRDKYGYVPHDFPVAFGEYERIISLPIYPAMLDQEVDSVIEAVADVVSKHSRRCSSAR